MNRLAADFISSRLRGARGSGERDLGVGVAGPPAVPRGAGAGFGAGFGELALEVAPGLAVFFVSGGGAGPEALLVRFPKVLPNLLVNIVVSFGPLEALVALGVAAG